MKISIIGAGHMGGAMIKGWVRSNAISPQDILVKGGKKGTASKLQEELMFSLIDSYEDMLESDIIYLAVNTKLILPVLTELYACLGDQDHIPIVSVSAGVSLEEMLAITGESYPLAKAIPNTPVQINQGITGVSLAPGMTDSATNVLTETLGLLGESVTIDEDQLGIFGTLAGCGPAFVDVFMEALADGAVLHGMDRDMAYHVAASMVSSAANLLLETGKHPGELKDGVTSPGGTTIKGITAMEKNGFRYATISAIDTIMTP